jgi:hypothetical protein
MATVGALDRFAHEFARMLCVPTSAVRAALEVLSERGAFLRPFPMAASKTAALICAAMAEGAGKSARAADQLFQMEFQCEVGPEATTDSRWQPKSRDTRSLGTQLTAVLESCGAHDDDRTELSPVLRAGLSLGWVPTGAAIALLQFDRPQRRVSLVYSSEAIFNGLTAGVRLTELQLHTNLLLHVDETDIAHLARVIRDLSGKPNDDTTAPLPQVGQLENSMWSEGWGFFKDSAGVRRIGRIDNDRRFANDAEAVKHVQSLAAIGEPLHEHAMQIYLTEDVCAPVRPVHP